MKTKKMRSVLIVLTTVTALVMLLNGYKEEKRISALNRSFSELYNDRLIAESHLFKMNDLLHEKQELQLYVTTAGSAIKKVQQQKKLSARFMMAYRDFLETKLCDAELIIIRRMSPQVATMNELEKKGDPGPSANARLLKNYSEILDQLDALSEIQVTEGTRITNDGHQTLASVTVATKLDAAVYFVFLLSVLALLRHTFLPGKALARFELN